MFSLPRVLARQLPKTEELPPQPRRRENSGGCDGCGLNMKRPVEVLHGQSSFGGFSVDFCGHCASIRKEMMKKLSKLTVAQRSVLPTRYEFK